MTESIRLADLSVAEFGRVVRIEAGCECAERLAVLGVTPGAEMEILRNEAGGPLLISICGTRLALGRDEAEKVTVQPMERPVEEAAEPEPSRPAVTIALAGQPNVGKSTLFNLLTGLNQHVGNWPGKTVEQRSGRMTWESREVEWIDLPGTYSLSSASAEEQVVREYFMQTPPDLVVVVLNAATLERNLYLVAELLELPMRLLLVVNMMDVAEQAQIRVHADALARATGLPVLPMSASRNQGVREMVAAAVRLAAEHPEQTPTRPTVRADHRPLVDRIAKILAEEDWSGEPAGWAALKLLEGDREISTRAKECLSPAGWSQVHSILAEHEDAFLDIVGGRYEWVTRMTHAAVERPGAGVVTLTDRLDRVLTHPAWGVVALVGIFGLVFWLTFSLAMPLANGLVLLVDRLAHAARDALGGGVLGGLVADGIFGGVGQVLSFVPILAVFYLVLGFLEDTGYFARAAYVMDRWMHRIGLHGKSFLPLFLGFGCNVPAVFGARILEDKRSRLLTILLAPFAPCTARMAVIVFLAPAFFGGWATVVTWGLVAGNILALAGLGWVLSRTLFRGQRSAFIMELPLYHVPNPRTLGLFVWNNTTSFFQKAGQIILAVSVVIWVLAYFPNGVATTSWLAGIGRTLEPVGAWFGAGDWRIMTALLSSFLAKENTIATLGVLFGEGNLAGMVARVLTPAGALGLLVVQMLFIPCAATAAAIRQEAGTRWMLISLGLQLAISFGAGVLVYQVAHLLGA